MILNAEDSACPEQPGGERDGLTLFLARLLQEARSHRHRPPADAG